jgi:Zn-finger nucleic acid-binding protein
MHPDTPRGVLVCGHCGSVDEGPSLAAHLDIGDQSSTKCPACATPLADGRLDGNSVLFCRQCEGLLIAMARFVEVAEALRARDDRARVILPREQMPGTRELSCPQCGGRMLNHVYGGPGNLVIDTCESCRLNWLDAGELRRLARAL